MAFIDIYFSTVGKFKECGRASNFQYKVEKIRLYSYNFLNERFTECRTLILFRDLKFL